MKVQAIANATPTVLRHLALVVPLPGVRVIEVFMVFYPFFDIGLSLRKIKSALCF
jgi:hypothetical protein